MRFLVLATLLGLLGPGPLAAEAVWVLTRGPDAVASVPLDPVQPVPAWRGLYEDGTDRVWVYATNSPHFFAPRAPEVRFVAETGWTFAVFFPAAWKSDRRLSWLDTWSAAYKTLATLPDPGWPVVFPAVLRKG